MSGGWSVTTARFGAARVVRVLDRVCEFQRGGEMNKEQQIAFSLLLLRDAIAEKEAITAQANSQLDRGGWTCDWAECLREINRTIAVRIECLERLAQ